jgi:transposase InsO family protein
VQVGFPSKGILTDNGGEFCNNEFREMASVTSICVLTTGAEAPYQNGLCERNHAIVDNMLHKLIMDNPKISDEISMLGKYGKKYIAELERLFQFSTCVRKKSHFVATLLSCYFVALCTGPFTYYVIKDGEGVSAK